MGEYCKPHRSRDKFDSYKGNNSYYKGVANSLGLAVFSLSNERAGPKDRKYDPSRSHYKKVSLLRDRLIPAVGSTPTIIFISPSWRGLLGSRRPKKAIAFSGGGPPRGCPVRPPWVCCVGSRFGPFGCGGFGLPATHLPHLNNNNNTTTSQPLLQLRTLQPLLQLRTLQLFFPSHPPYNSNYITDTRGLVPERA